MDADPLSDVLSLFDMRSAAISRLEAGGSWALSFPAKPTLKFHAVLRGHCWIKLPDQEARPLRQGDIFLLANTPPFVLASDPHQAPEEASKVFTAEQRGTYRYGGNETLILGGGFVFGNIPWQLLLDTFPAFMLFSSDSTAAELLRSTLYALDRELEGQAMGSVLMTRRLADILLVQALRAHLESPQNEGIGWLGALGDKPIGTALALMHRDVAHPWKVDELAAAIGMSRSGFAARFKARVGMPPLDYLLHWRMQIARNDLQRSETSLSRLASKLGYGSESAFSNAFKRVVGQPPKHYQRRKRLNKPV